MYVRYRRRIAYWFETMPSIVLKNLSVDIPVYQTRSQSLRHCCDGEGAGDRRKTLSNSGTRISIVRALDSDQLQTRRGRSPWSDRSERRREKYAHTCLADIYAPSTGTIKRQGTLIPMFDIGIGFDQEATGYENIFLRGMMMGLTRREIAN